MLALLFHIYLVCLKLPFTESNALYVLQAVWVSKRNQSRSMIFDITVL